MASILEKYPNSITRKKTQKKIGDVIYCEEESFSLGVLPTARDVVQCLLFLLRPDRSGRTQRTIEDARYMVVSTLVDQWLYCNIYTIGLKHVKKRILKLYGEFKQHINYSRQKPYQKPEKKSLFDLFNSKMETLFDIFCEDKGKKRAHEKFYSVKMEDMEFQFLKDQCSDRKMFSTELVNRRWQKTMQRKMQHEKYLEEMKLKEKPLEVDEHSSENFEPMIDNEHLVIEDESEFDESESCMPLEKRKLTPVFSSVSDPIEIQKHQHKHQYITTSFLQNSGHTNQQISLLKTSSCSCSH